MPDSAQQPLGMPDDRWQDLLRSMDPVANLNALSDVWRQAASSSEQVVSEFVGGSGEAGNGSTTDGAGFSDRDLRVDFERAVDQMAEAAKRFLGQMPWGVGAVPDAATPKPVVTVLDGVGTTEVSLPTGPASPDAQVAETGPWATDLVAHDGSRIDRANVTVRATPSFGDDPDGHRDPSFILKVVVPDDTEPGVYHGQILCPGSVDFVLPFEARVHRQG